MIVGHIDQGAATAFVPFHMEGLLTSSIQTGFSPSTDSFHTSARFTSWFAPVLLTDVWLGYG